MWSPNTPTDASSIIDNDAVSIGKVLQIFKNYKHANDGATLWGYIWQLYNKPSGNNVDGKVYPTTGH